MGRRQDEAMDIAPEREEREDQWNIGSREKKGDGREEKKTGGGKEKHRKNSKTKEEEDGDMEGRKERIEERRRRNHLPGKEKKKTTYLEKKKPLTWRRNPDWNLKRRRKQLIRQTNKYTYLIGAPVEERRKTN